MRQTRVLLVVGAGEGAWVKVRKEDAPPNGLPWGLWLPDLDKKNQTGSKEAWSP